MCQLRKDVWINCRYVCNIQKAGKKNSKQIKTNRSISHPCYNKSLFQSQWNLRVQRFTQQIDIVLLSSALVCPLRTTAGPLQRTYLGFVTNKMLYRKCLFNWSRFCLFFFFFFQSRDCIWWHQQFWLHSPAAVLLCLQWQNLCYRSFFFRAMPELVTFVTFLTYYFLSYI